MSRKTVHTCPLPEILEVSESEAAAQERVVAELRRAKVLFCAVPNGGTRDKREAISLKRGGLQKGAPDLLVFDTPRGSSVPGVAIEMKRKRGGRLAPEQEDFLKALSERGWLTFVCRGSDEALAVLRGLEIIP